MLASRLVDMSAAVALRKESVDRNMLSLSCLLVAGVALRKESVDRNHQLMYHLSTYQKSLSARRAWIEIPVGSALKGRDRVALRKESVDRNHAADISASRETRSLSARRAWIEIQKLLKKY